MADTKKSILEEALKDAKLIQEALNANSKEILRSVAREEIDEVIKESLEEDYLEEDVDIEDVDMDSEEGEAEEEMESGEGEVESEEDEAEVNLDSEENYDDISVDANDETEEGDNLEGDYDVEMGADASDGIELDMTTASDEDVISIYKKLSNDDDIEVVMDDESGDITLNVTEPGEFVIKNNATAPVEADIEADIEMDVEDEMGIEGDEELDLDSVEDEDEIVYEITLDEDVVRTATSDIVTSMTGDLASGDIEGQKAVADTDSGDNLDGGFTEEDPNGSSDGHADHVMNEEEEITEEEEIEGDEVSEKIQVGKARTVANNSTEIKGAGGKANNVKAPNVTSVSESEVKYKKLLSEATDLKNKNDEYKQVLKNFKTMLAETVVFNSNLTYVTKLFMEHSTTKTEKSAIYKRFDNEVSTLKESKRLFKTISSELANRKTMTESLDKKLNKDVSTSSSAQLNENTAYVDKGTSRIIELMNRVDNRNKNQ